MLRYWLVACGLMVLGMAAQAGETAHLKYRQIYDMLVKAEDAPMTERDKVNFQFRMVSNNKEAAPLKLWIDLDGHHYDIPVGAKGQFVLPREKELVNSDPYIETNQPKGTLNLIGGVILLIPDMAHFRYSELRAAARQADAAAARVVGTLSMFAPNIDQVVFTCAEPKDCGIIVHHKDRDEIIRPDKTGVVSLSFSGKLDNEDPLIEPIKPLIEIAAADD